MKLQQRKTLGPLERWCTPRHTAAEESPCPWIEKNGRQRLKKPRTKEEEDKTFQIMDKVKIGVRHVSSNSGTGRESDICLLDRVMVIK